MADRKTRRRSGVTLGFSMSEKLSKSALPLLTHLCQKLDVD